MAFTFLFQACGDASQNKGNGKKQSILLSNPHNKASCVYLTNDQNNNPVVSWVEIDSSGEKHFFFAQFDSTQEQMLEPISIPIEQNASIHEEEMPKIGVKRNGTLVATYETSTPQEGQRWGLGDIRYVQSFDHGKSWTDPQSVAPKALAEGLSASFTDLVRLGNGEIGISWLGKNKADSVMARPVFFAKTDGHRGFDTPKLITRYACQCCRTSLSSDENGDISIAFRDILPGSIRDISVSTSCDNGHTFSVPTSFSNDHWMVDGCPHAGPSVASRNGNTYVVWYTGANNKSGVYYAALDSNREIMNKRFLNPNSRFIQLTLQPNGSRIIAHDENYRIGDSLYSRIVVNKVNGEGFFRKRISPQRSHASYPVVVPLGNEKTLVAWTDQMKEEVYYKLVKTTLIFRPLPESSFLSDKRRNSGIAVSLLASSIDPVCGMTLYDGSISDTTSFQEAVIGFCSKDCKRDFLKHPQHYFVE